MAEMLTAKQPYEAYSGFFDFTAKLTGGETIASAVITATDMATLADVTAIILDAGQQSNTDTIVYDWMRAGTARHYYLITCRVTGSMGSLYELDAVLPVLEDATPYSASHGVYASEIFSEVDGVLLDVGKDRWPDAEKLKYLNAGQRQSVIFKPDVYTLNEIYKLVAGTKQTVPNGTVAFQTPAGATIKECIQLIRLVRNMGTTGLAAGPAIAPVGMDMLDAYDPDWHSATGVAVVKNYVFNDSDPRHFYVTPPQPSANQGYVEVIFSACPADVIAAVDPAVSYDVPISVSDVYREILINYILHRCYAKDAALSPYNAQRAVEYWNLFVLGLERKDLVKKEYNPNVKRQNPSTE
jgi:hypothetical protein